MSDNPKDSQIAALLDYPSDRLCLTGLKRESSVYCQFECFTLGKCIENGNITLQPCPPRYNEILQIPSLELTSPLLWSHQKIDKLLGRII